MQHEKLLPAILKFLSNTFFVNFVLLVDKICTRYGAGIGIPEFLILLFLMSPACLHARQKINTKKVPPLPLQSVLLYLKMLAAAADQTATELY